MFATLTDDFVLRYLDLHYYSERNMMSEGKRIDKNTIATIGLTFVNGVGPKIFEKLMGRFDSPEEILNASVDELCEIPRLTSKIAESIHAIDLEAVEVELMALEEFGVTGITRYDKSYPQNLKTISDAPPVLFQTGDFRDEDSRAVAVVGTRQPSQRGRKIATELAYGLAKLGFTIASGLALGIDTAAHQGALQAGGRTIAVLGSGIKIIHPSQNRGLADEIRQSGGIFSELHPNTRPSSGTLMSRDRIISGLALGTIIVESTENSGSMDTAKRTIIQGRKLFAVANESKGNQKLIDEGA
ncbi:DNA-protecting protein DprA, partial [bacterium]|nr:DNA-protecting protein DprA [bacterium]